jgi:hypothetical protein
VSEAIGYRVPITAEVRDLARSLYPVGRDYSKTDLGLEAPIVGAFGEAVFATACREIMFAVDYVGNRLITHDFESSVGTIEVKTKATNYRPGGEFFAGISARALEFQKADLLAFVSLWPKSNEEDAWSYQEGYVVGFIPRLDFVERARFEPVGTIMGGGRPSTRDMWTVKFRELLPFTSISAAKIPVKH